MKPQAFFAIAVVGFAGIAAATSQITPYETPEANQPTVTTPAVATPQSVVAKHEISMRWSCEDAIKAQLRDPRSYEAVEVRYVPAAFKEAPGQIVDTRISFRSRNGFGGMAGGFARCGHNAAGKIVRTPNVVAN